MKFTPLSSLDIQTPQAEANRLFKEHFEDWAWAESQIQTQMLLALKAVFLPIIEQRKPLVISHAAFTQIFKSVSVLLQRHEFIYSLFPDLMQEYWTEILQPEIAKVFDDAQFQWTEEIHEQWKSLTIIPLGRQTPNAWLAFSLKGHCLQTQTMADSSFQIFHYV